MNLNIIKVFTIIFLLSSVSYAQDYKIDMDDDDLNIGGDIFSDFNEDLEDNQVLEDERFYKYGRFFSFQVGLGLTTFSGNRGLAYEDDHPSYNLGLNYFMDFQSSFGMGVEYSRHHMVLEQATKKYNDGSLEPGFGFVSVDLVRAYFSYRFYVDTTNLGTAITYSNPYLTTRIEYWYLTSEFEDREDVENITGGGIGFGLGGGFEFPIKLKESYIGVEFLWHTVNFPDKYTEDFQPYQDNSFGYEDLTGDAYSVMVTYVMNW